MTRTPDYEALAAEYVNNWKKFDSFILGDVEAEGCAIIYTENREADLLMRCNAAVIEKRIGKLPGVFEYSANHWACGHISGYRIRVYTKAHKVTKAFKVWCDIQAQLDAYPILNDDVYTVMLDDAMSSYAESEGINLSEITEDEYDRIRNICQE